MPKLKIGTIPNTRLSAARKVRDKLKSILGPNGYALVSIFNGGYSVVVRLFEGKILTHPIDTIVDGIPIKTTRVKN